MAKIYQHKYGGIYEIVVRDDQYILYKHLWPFEQTLNHKTVDEFAESFSPIEEKDFEKLQSLYSAASFQQLISRAKESKCHFSSLM